MHGILSCFSRVQLFATPWTVAHQAPLSTGFSRQEYWSGLPCPPPGDLPNPRIKPVSHVSCIGRQVLHHLRHLGSPCLAIHRKSVPTPALKTSRPFFINKSPILLSSLIPGTWSSFRIRWSETSLRTDSGTSVQPQLCLFLSCRTVCR